MRQMETSSFACGSPLRSRKRRVQAVARYNAAQPVQHPFSSMLQAVCWARSVNERFRARAFGAAACLVFCGQHGAAQPSRGPGPVESSPARRTLVVFAVKGRLEGEVQASLQRLLSAELRAAGLVLRERALSQPLSAWARHAESEALPLLAVVLEVEPDRLRLIVIDSARGRAIARELPGGVAENAANVEAVVSIVLSASRALLEGLEVASTPVDAVLGDEAPPSKPDVARDRARTPVFPAPKAGRQPSPTAAATALHASVAGTLSTFSEVEDVTPGLAIAAALSLASRLELRISASRQRTATVATEFGEFALERSSGSLAAGLIFQSGDFTLLPELAFVAEWLSRTDTKPTAEAAANPSRTSARFGAELGGRARFAFLPPLSAELGAGVAYFGRRVRFTVADRDETELVRVGPLTLGARLGLDVVFD